MKRGLLLKIASLITGVAFVCLSALPASASGSSSVDYNYYGITYDEVTSSISSIKGDSFWQKHMAFEETEKGVRIGFVNAVMNMRVEAPAALALDGMHAVFSQLSGDANTKFAFVLTQRQQYSAYLDSSTDVLAWLPAAIILDTATGEVTVNAAKAYHKNNNSIISTKILQSDNLKMSALSEKEWDISFKLDDKSTDDENDDEWIILVAGETASVKSSLLIDKTSELDPLELYLAISCWNASGNNFSFVWQSVHGGKSTCADDPSSHQQLENADKMITAINSIGAVTYDKGALITSIRETYDNIPNSVKSFIKNYNVFKIKETAYSFVKEIAELNAPSADALSFIKDFDGRFSNLSDEIKNEITNYNTYTEYKNKCLSLAGKAALDKPYIIETEKTVKSGTDTQITNYVDVDGVTKTNNVTKTLTTSGRDGTQYLWIIFTATGVILLAAAATAVVLKIRDKKRR